MRHHKKVYRYSLESRFDKRVGTKELCLVFKHLSKRSNFLDIKKHENLFL